MDHHLKRALLTKGNARKKQFIRVIVQFKEPLNDKHIHLLRKHLFPHALKDCRRLHMVRSIAATVPADGLKHMCRCRPVHRIYIDRKRRALLNIATPAVGAAAAQRSGWKGRGVTIAILDTGIFPHPDLTQPRNRIIAFKDFVNGRKKPYDDNGHGTHCAGDAAGNGHQSHGKYRGPAPEAKLVGVKVLDKFGMGYDSRIIQGIQWCLDHRKRYGIHVLSLSLGAKAKVPCSKDPLCQAVGKAWQRGLVVTVSAGNSGPKAKTIESPGISPSVITVGATDAAKDMDFR
jgi:serine protease AprX